MSKPPAFRWCAIAATSVLVGAGSPVVAPAAAAADIRQATPRAAAAAPADGPAWASLITRQSGPTSGIARSYLGSGDSGANPWTREPDASAGQFTFATRYVLADVTGDARDDLLVIDPNTDRGTLFVYPNTGADGAARWGDRYPAGTGWNDTNSLAAFDVTGDGKVDLVARAPGDTNGTLRIYVNNGSRTANPFTTTIHAGTGWNLAADIQIGQVDADGNPDVLVRNTSGRLVYYRGNGSTTSNPWTTASVSATPAAVGIEQAVGTVDADADGRLDVLVRGDDGELQLRLNTGTQGSFYDADPVAAGTGWDTAGMPVAGNLEGNGAIDLLSIVPAGGDLMVYPNSKSDSGSPVGTPERIPGVLVGATVLRVGDIDGDGRRDLVVKYPGLLGGRLVALLHDGSSATFPWTRREPLGTEWDRYREILVGDMDGDGRSDVLGMDHTGELYLYRSEVRDGNPALGSRVPIGSGFAVDRIALGDVDLDGIDDLVALRNDGSLWAYRAAGGDDGPVRIPGDFSGYRALALGPLDGSGRDCLIAEDPAGELWAYPNSGSGPNPFTLGRRSAGTGWAIALDIGA